MDKPLNILKVSNILLLFITIFIQGNIFSQVGSFQLTQSIQKPNLESSTNFISPYELKFKREMALFGTGIITNIAGLIIANNIEPLTATEINELDIDDINDFDRKAIKPYSESANGDYLLYGSFLLPLTFLADDNTRRDWQILGIMWFEVLALQTGINLLVKSLSLRTRPYVYDPDTPMEKKQTTEARLSFYSGHTSTTAATTFFVARVFSDYFDDKLARTLIWSGAILYPALVGYARRNTGNHFRTDVIVGYLIGASIGYFIPELHLKNDSLNVSFYRNIQNDSFNLKIVYLF